MAEPTSRTHVHCLLRVSQRLALLELTPSLQEKVESGELKVEPARRTGWMPKEQQAEAAELAINAVKPPRQRGPKGEEAPAAEPSSTLARLGAGTGPVRAAVYLVGRCHEGVEHELQLLPAPVGSEEEGSRRSLEEGE
ncbi:hypothetical protein GCM10010250_67560 [Streptomyces althioticus]|nr:hypothetical protein GCM10010250_67560 [Streptomyces althioticus]